MKLILHIGTEKTGSTSFQAWGDLNREALIGQGVFYSRVMGKANHFSAYLWALNDVTGRDHVGAGKLKDPASYAAFRANLPGELAAEVAEARARGCHGFVISSEHCQSRLEQPEEVARLHGLLAPLFDEMEVLCCLRPQLDLIVSAISTLARSLLPVGQAQLDAERLSKRSLTDYESLVARWSDAFGPGALRLTPYNTGPGVIAVVAQEFGIDRKALQVPARLNRALDIRTIALTNALAQMPPQDRRAIHPMIRPLLDMLPGDEAPNPGIEAARRIHQQFVAANARLAAGRDDITEADLEPDWSRYQGPGNFHLLEPDCQFAEQLGGLVRAMHRRQVISTIRVRLANAESAMAQGRSARARKLLGLVGEDMDKLTAAGEIRHADQLRNRLARLEQEVSDMEPDVD